MLSERLRREASQWDGTPRADLLREAATEIERLESLVGEASYYTDSHWGARLAADHGVAAAAGYWERHLAARGGR